LLGRRSAAPPGRSQAMLALNGNAPLTVINAFGMRRSVSHCGISAQVLIWIGAR
jgi:hypothetical protein